MASYYTHAQQAYWVYGGVGLKVGKDIQNNEFYVEAVTKGTPAERAGLVRNDKLISVDGTSVAGIPTSEVGALLQGEEGTNVTLIIQHAGSEESAEVELTRERYAVKQEFKAFSPEQSGGLYTGSSGVKPPAALYVAALGMKKGGKRTVQVPAAVAYGENGYNEIPENSDITMEIEVLSIA
ncbi:hypothetical protein CYMTET_8753 [Cymbomonas tetramitiformis]|uniref:peptidylprolyl isomerase n=1 Tax=Cymbomonas tetramitiformis TaxID=36881 RepID=A0AAE0GSN5_9CHLO|nr:hypothetical protein CYMTET_8753 [Cymbomonas tetramitiformis]